MVQFAAEAGQRLHKIVRLQRYYSKGGLVTQYKSEVLSCLQSFAPTIYHASRSSLALLDSIQNQFLTTLDLTAEVALVEHNLAPLNVRRDIAVLGLLYRLAHGRAPKPLQELFR